MLAYGLLFVYWLLKMAFELLLKMAFELLL